MRRRRDVFHVTSCCGDAGVTRDDYTATWFHATASPCCSDGVSSCNPALKPASGRPCVSSTVSGFPVLCLRFYAADLWVSSETMLSFEKNARCSESCMFYPCAHSNVTVEVNTPAFKRAELKCSDCSKMQRKPQKGDLCVLASSRCRELLGSAGTQGRPEDGFSEWREPLGTYSWCSGCSSSWWLSGRRWCPVLSGRYPTAGLPQTPEQIHR